MKLLVVEDDPRLAKLIGEGLLEDGFLVEHAANATLGENMAQMLAFDALILDVMLPEGAEAGFRLARQLRSHNNHTPILFLTARADMDSKMLGFETGGDDYLSKPFDFRELLARIHALVRRAKGGSSHLMPLPLGYSLNLKAREICHNGQAIALTPREYALIECFGINAGRAFSRNELIERVWAEESQVEQKAVDVYVSILRRKLGEAMIETVRGIGYRLGRLETV